MNRADLLSGKAAGLRASGPRDENALFFFHRGASKEVVRNSCLECHSNDGLPASAMRLAEHNIRTHQIFIDGIAMKASTLEAEAEVALAWKRADKSWATLIPFWPKE